MKSLKLILLITFICPLYSFSQMPRDIETNLCNLFSRIDYWQQKENEAAFAATAPDSLDAANDAFAKNLLFYTEKYPATITSDFKLLKKAHLHISSSPDGLFRIYSWDTETGGTMHIFENILQYRTGNTVKSEAETAGSEDGDNSYVFFYTDIYTLKVGNKTCYLGIYRGIYSSRAMEEGINVFFVDNGNLVKDTKIIKTATGLHGKLSFTYDFFSKTANADADIHYNPVSKIISLPIVKGEGKVTASRIIYKFNGKYFERVIN